MVIEVILQLFEELNSTATTKKKITFLEERFAEDTLTGTSNRQEVSKSLLCLLALECSSIALLMRD